jgi:hypothetical protein
MSQSSSKKSNFILLKTEGNYNQGGYNGQQQQQQGNGGHHQPAPLHEHNYNNHNGQNHHGGNFQQGQQPSKGFSLSKYQNTTFSPSLVPGGNNGNNGKNYPKY